MTRLSAVDGAFKHVRLGLPPRLGAIDRRRTIARLVILCRVCTVYIRFIKRATWVKLITLDGLPTVARLAAQGSLDTLFELCTLGKLGWLRSVARLRRLGRLHTVARLCTLGKLRMLMQLGTQGKEITSLG